MDRCRGLIPLSTRPSAPVTQHSIIAPGRKTGSSKGRSRWKADCVFFPLPVANLGLRNFFHVENASWSCCRVFYFPVVREKIDPFKFRPWRGHPIMPLPALVSLRSATMKDESIFVCFNPPLKPKLCDHSFLASVNVSARDSRFLTHNISITCSLLRRQRCYITADGPGSLSWSEAPDPSLLSHFQTFDLVTLGDPTGVNWCNSEGW